MTCSQPNSDKAFVYTAPDFPDIPIQSGRDHLPLFLYIAATI